MNTQKFAELGHLKDLFKGGNMHHSIEFGKTCLIVGKLGAMYHPQTRTPIQYKDGILPG